MLNITASWTHNVHLCFFSGQSYFGIDISFNDFIDLLNDITVTNGVFTSLEIMGKHFHDVGKFS